MAEQFFRQCLCEKPEKLIHNKGAYADRMVCWVPEQLAKTGKYLKFDDLGDGWKVVWVYTTRLSNKEISDRSRDWTRTREASDI